MEPESALAYPPDSEGMVLVRTGEQNVYDGQRYVADTLGIPRDRVRVVSEYVGGGFGGKEDQTVQHHRGPAGMALRTAGEMHAGQGGEHPGPREASSHDHSAARWAATRPESWSVSSQPSWRTPARMPPWEGPFCTGR